MKNLVIIGNGFDLAHGLKTNYLQFIQDLKNNSVKYVNNINFQKNEVLKALSQDKHEKWSDIEYVYYDILTHLGDPSLGKYRVNFHPFYGVEELNKDFNEIKNCLELYLKEEEQNFEFVGNYTSFFDLLNEKESVVLNFNYTNTVRRYIENKNLGIELIHIHGELNNPENPMIFGFAAEDGESYKLLQENDNSYVRNIKKFNYLFTNNEDRLKTLLKKSPEYNVFILGQSCGISDKLVLSQILNSKNIHKIYPFYFRDRDGYFETMVNIDRIIDDYSEKDKKAFTKLVSFPKSYLMPQQPEDDNFVPYLKSILDKIMPRERRRINHRINIANL